MTMVKTRIRVAPDGTLTGQAPGLPAGEHEAEIVLLDDADQLAGLCARKASQRARTVQGQFKGNDFSRTDLLIAVGS